MPHLRIALLVALAAQPSRAQVTDPAFVQTEVVAPSTQAGTSGIAWAPDGTNRLFYTRQTGLVRVVENGSLLATPFAVISPVEADNVETGVIGLAFDPNYLVNRYLYVRVVVSTSEQQIIRYRDEGNVGVDKTVVVAGLPTRGVNHNGGAIGFGPDGKLYWAIGDLGNGVGTDDDLTSLAAKIARADLDGSAPVDNPFFDGDGPNEDRIWARGFRNPFSFTWQPSTDQLWVNVTGAAYEQIFTPSVGDHAGWSTYQNNQPEGYLPPVIAYRSARSDRLEIAASGATRDQGLATFTTTGVHGLRVGEKVTISGVVDASFNGEFFVSSVESPTIFSVAQQGAAAESGGGLATTLLIGGALTGGAFWDSSAVPAAYRGNFFFGDYISQNIARATFASDNVVASVDIWATAPGRMIDMAVGPDGNMYYATFNGGLYRLEQTAPSQGIIASHLHVRVPEAGRGGYSIRLAQVPSSPTNVQITHSGDANVTLVPPTTLTFDDSNWAIPQFVEVSAAEDDDAAQNEAVLTASAEGMEGVETTVRVTDDDLLALGGIPEELSLVEGADAELVLTLNGPPSRPLAIRTLVEGDVMLTHGQELLLNASNWSEEHHLRFSAENDDDQEDETALLTIDAAWLGHLQVSIGIDDDDGNVAAGGGGGEPPGGDHEGGRPSHYTGGGGHAESEGGRTSEGGASDQSGSRDVKESDCTCSVPGDRGGTNHLASWGLGLAVWWRRTRARRPGISQA